MRHELLTQHAFCIGVYAKKESAFRDAYCTSSSAHTVQYYIRGSFSWLWHAFVLILF